jgi:hypothetical protein
MCKLMHMFERLVTLGFKFCISFKILKARGISMKPDAS